MQQAISYDELPNGMNIRPANRSCAGYPRPTGSAETTANRASLTITTFIVSDAAMSSISAAACPKLTAWPAAVIPFCADLFHLEINPEIRTSSRKVDGDLCGANQK